MNMGTKAATGKTLKSQSRRSLNLKRATAPKTGTHGSASKDVKVARRTRTTKSLRLPVCAKVPRRPVDFLAIFVAGVASIVIVINALFWQSGPGMDELEQLFSVLQETHKSLEFEGKRLQHKIDNASSLD